MRIIGMSGDYVRHDASLCLVEDGRVLYACSEERFSRLKNDPRAPLLTLLDILERFDLTMDDIDVFAVGMPPFKFLRGLFEAPPKLLAQTLLPVVAGGPSSFLRYFTERVADGRAKRHGFDWLPRGKVRYVSHYLSHAASAYRTSGMNEALCVTCDAAGADETGHPYSGAAFLCKDGRMTPLDAISRYASIGCFYNAVTQAAAFRPVGEDWKLMGLAAFGDSERCYAQMKPLAPRFENGRWVVTRHSIEAKLIDRPALLKRTTLWKTLSELVDRYGDRDVAAAAQRVFEENMLEYFEHLFARTKTRNLVLAGGAFHNIKFCMRLTERHPELSLHVHPAAGDPGTAVGAALEAYHQIAGRPAMHHLESMALGPEFSEAEILGELTKVADKVAWERPDDFSMAVARELAAGRVIGFYGGRAEWGPRALGQRSVIADPRKAETRDHINKTLKNRDWFMPFAPSIMEEDGPRYLQNYHYSPFMTHAFKVTEEARRDIPAAVHLDGTARPQIVRRDVNPRYHGVIAAFKELTGVGAVLNTSFNRHGLPVVNAPREAIDHLLWGCVDLLAAGPFLVRRTGEPLPFKKRLSLTTDELIGKWEPFDERMEAIRRRRLEPAGGDVSGKE